jgi:hypothetical protein
VAEARERLAVNKQILHRFHMERFSPKELNEIECEEQYCVEVPKRYSALEDLEAEVHINSSWETIREHKNFRQMETLLISEVA